jgi:membrane peptidoglycan carboxypeptidase
MAVSGGRNAVAQQQNEGRKRIWRRIRRIGYLVLALVVITPVAAFVVVDRVVAAPDPAEITARQAKLVTLYYSDGTVMTRIASPGANRTVIDGKDITEAVRHAVYAAEQPDFETASDFDFGSGLAKQYLNMVSADNVKSLGRDFTDLVTARKLNTEHSKEQILTGYLNTVHLGRTAYGVVAAARMYYDKNVADLTPSEAALIAGMIQNPARSESTTFALARWNAVMDTMVAHGWITREYRDQAVYPTPVPEERTRLVPLKGSRAHIQAQIERELAEVGFGVEQAQQAGLKIYTTIDPKTQQAAELAVEEVMANQPRDLRQSLTAIDPTTGAVRAYSANRDGAGIDYARGTLQQPGTTFLPFDLVAGLQKGVGLGTKFDGTSPRDFAGVAVRNPGDNQACGKECTLRAAMEQNVTTPFYDLVTNNTGPLAVANAARGAGIPESVDIANVRRQLLVGSDGVSPDPAIAIGGGPTLIRPFDLAAAYSAFAAEGVRRAPYFVAKIEGASGLVYQHKDEPRPAFDNDAAKSRAIASNVTAVLKPIPALAKVPCGLRECAGKPGAQLVKDSVAENSKAWMVGYTPSLVASVWMGTDAGTTPLRNAAGVSIDGAGLPGDIWRRFMDTALSNTPPVAFPAPIPIGQFE